MKIKNVLTTPHTPTSDLTSFRKSNGVRYPKRLLRAPRVTFWDVATTGTGATTVGWKDGILTTTVLTTDSK